MSEIHQGYGKGILAAAVVGAAVGAAVALLFAPCSGKETRGWVADRSRKIKDGTTRVYEQGKDAARRVAGVAGQ